MVNSAITPILASSTFQRATGRVSSILIVPDPDSDDTRSAHRIVTSIGISSAAASTPKAFEYSGPVWRLGLMSRSRW